MARAGFASILPLFLVMICGGASPANATLRALPQKASQRSAEEPSLPARAMQASTAGVQTSVISRNLIEVLPISDLPLEINEAVITRTRKGESLKLSITNGSSEQILGLRYWLLVVDPANRIRVAVDHSESLKIEAAAAVRVTFPGPTRSRISADDRVFMVIAHVIGRDSIWEVQQAKSVLVAYIQGTGYTVPAVLHMLNQVDSPIGLNPFFLRK